MKLQAKLFVIALLLFCSAHAQSPEGFNYQAVIRNSAGEILVNQSVGIRMSLIQGSANGSMVYRETFSKTTNSFGLINLIIGTGTVTTGSFSTIDWGAGPYFLETAIDNNGGTSYAVLGTSQLMSVPFALYAQSAANDGIDGQDGASAYQVWLDAGNTGSEAEFLASLVGTGGSAQDISLSGTELSITDGSTVDLSAIDTDTDTQLSETEVDDFVANNGYLTTEIDGDVTNEIQDLSLSGSTLSITNNSSATAIDLAPFTGTNTDSQDLQLSGSTLSLTGDPDNTAVDLTAFDTNTQLSEMEVDDFVANNGYLTSFTEVDGDANNEIQDLNLSGSTLTITNNSSATSIDLAPFTGTNTDNQDLQLSGSTLSLTGDPDNTAVDLTAFDTNTQLSETEVDAFVADNGYLTSFTEVDGDATNEIQNISLSGSDLSISGGSTIDLSTIDTDTNTQLSETEVDNFVANNGYLTSFTEVDGDATNEIQTLSIDDNQVSLSNGGGTITLPENPDFSIINELNTSVILNDTDLETTDAGGTITTDLSSLIDDADADPANEIQDLTLNDNQFSITGGSTTITFDPSASNEIQEISTDTNPGNITISDGATLALNVDDADADPLNEVNTTVELNGTDLETTDAGGTITTDLSSLVNDADADPLNETNTGIILNDTDLETTDADGTIITDLSSLVDDADADSSNELQEISTDNTPGNISITDGATLALNVDDGDADAMNEIQDLEVIGDTLFVTGNSTPTKVLLGGRNSYGDIKHSLRLTDHDGWYKLDGRALSALPETAAQVAMDFFAGNLPDATDRFLKGNDGAETNGDVGGSNSITIAQENLEDFSLPVTEDIAGLHNHTASSSTNGSHSHTIASISGVGSTNNRVIAGDSGASDGNKSTNSTGSHSHTITVDNGGNHVHNVAVSSGGNGLTPIPKPSFLATNIFVYLGSATLEDLQNLGLSDQEILTSGVSPLTLWNDNNAILDDLIGLDYNGSPITLQTFVDQGIDLTFLYTQYGQSLLDNTSVTTLDLFNEGITIATLDGNGITLSTMRTDGITMADIYGSVLYSFQDLRDGGFAIEEIVTLTDYQTMVDQGVATYQEFLAVPTSPLILWNANNAVLDDLSGLTYQSNPITLQTFVDQTISLSFLYGQYVNDIISLTTATTFDLFTSGVTIGAMNANGVNLAVMVADGILIADLDAAGVYTLQQLKDNFDATSMLTIATVAELLDETTGTDITVFELRVGGALAADFHGVSFMGGIIFYTQADGTTYVAQAGDQSTGIIWAGDGGGVSTNNNIGSGSSNTDNMLVYDVGPNAASICRDLGPEWFLPSRNEIREMYDNILTEGNFQTGTAYWMSSDDGNNSRAGSFSFADRSDNQTDRVTLLYVRAIKSFVSAPD